MSWQRKKVGDILKLEYGKPLDKSLRTEHGKYPAYGANGIKCFSNEYYHDKATIIVGRKGSAGELTLTEDKFWPLDVTYFVTFDESEYDLKFIYFILKQLDLPSLATGVKPGINRNNVYALEVDVPEINEQRKIVTALEQSIFDIDTVQNIYEEKIKLLDELRYSVLEKALTPESNTSKGTA